MFVEDVHSARRDVLLAVLLLSRWVIGWNNRWGEARRGETGCGGCIRWQRHRRGSHHVTSQRSSSSSSRGGAGLSTRAALYVTWMSRERERERELKPGPHLAACRLFGTITYNNQKTSFLLRDAHMHSAYLLRRRGWLVGWVSVTRRYCIKTAEPILKFFRPPGSPIILVPSYPCADIQFQGEPLQRGRTIFEQS